jgi:hypothetical protein
MLTVAAASILTLFVLVRVLMNRQGGGYHRRFMGTLHRDNNASRDDGAFPITSTLYLGDGGSSSHAQHAHHATNCGHPSDGGASGSDGGGGSH